MERADWEWCGQGRGGHGEASSRWDRGEGGQAGGDTRWLGGGLRNRTLLLVDRKSFATGTSRCRKCACYGCCCGLW